MRKVIAAINMTIDGYCDHTAVNPDEEIHQHYTDMINSAGVLLYGSITYRLMQYWQSVLENPTGTKELDEFAAAIDKIPKIVFSNSMNQNDIGWKSASLATRNLEEEVKVLKKLPGNDIFACSPSLIVQLTNLKLIDEYQLCIHPVIVGSGLQLFKNIHERTTLGLVNSKFFRSGAVIHYYTPEN